MTREALQNILYLYIDGKDIPHIMSCIDDYAANLKVNNLEQKKQPVKECAGCGRRINECVCP